MTENTLRARFEQAATARPELARRITAAADILSRHFANRAARVITARLAADGQLVYTVKGSGKNVYTVTYNSCDCPDANDPRRPGVCKHQLAVRALESLCEHPHGAPVAVGVSAVAVVEWAPAGGWLSDQPRQRTEWEV